MPLPLFCQITNDEVYNLTASCLLHCSAPLVVYSDCCIARFIACGFLAQCLSTGRAKKSNPLGKTRYLQNCSNFFRQIYRVYRRGFRPHILQISFEYFFAFENYNYLNLNVHFSK